MFQHEEARKAVTKVVLLRDRQDRHLTLSMRMLIHPSDSGNFALNISQSPHKHKIQKTHLPNIKNKIVL